MGAEKATRANKTYRQHMKWLAKDLADFLDFDEFEEWLGMFTRPDTPMSAVLSGFYARHRVQRAQNALEEARSQL